MEHPSKRRVTLLRVLEEGDPPFTLEQEKGIPRFAPTLADAVGGCIRTPSSVRGGCDFPDILAGAVSAPAFLEMMT